MNGLYRYRIFTKMRHEDGSLNLTFIYTTAMCNDEDLNDSTIRHVAPLGHIILISSPLVFVFTP